MNQAGELHIDFIKLNISFVFHGAQKEGLHDVEAIGIQAPTVRVASGSGGTTATDGADAAEGASSIGGAVAVPTAAEVGGGGSERAVLESESHDWEASSVTRHT